MTVKRILSMVLAFFILFLLIACTKTSKPVTIRTTDTLTIRDTVKITDTLKQKDTVVEDSLNVTITQIDSISFAGLTDIRGFTNTPQDNLGVTFKVTLSSGKAYYFNQPISQNQLGFYIPITVGDWLVMSNAPDLQIVEMINYVNSIGEDYKSSYDLHGLMGQWVPYN